MSQLFENRSHRMFVARLAIVELHSVAGIKVRTGAFIGKAADQFLTDIDAVVSSGRIIVQRVQDDEYNNAAELLKRYAREYRNRTLDALHLAAALRRRARSGVDFFVTSDLNLGTVAAIEGFAVLNPEAQLSI